MGSEVKRLLSVTGHMVTSTRNRLQANTISLCQILRSWYDAGVIRDLNPILAWNANENMGWDD